MTICPRCSTSVPAYTRCEGCGLMLGFDGLTVLIEYEEAPEYERVREIAGKHGSSSEWQEENGQRFLRMTYSFSELEKFRELAKAASPLSRKKTFVNGLEIPWSRALDASILNFQSPQETPSGSRPN